MACDLQGTIGDAQMLKTGPKIHYCLANELTYPDSDFIIGFAGEAGLNAELADFFKFPDAYQKPPHVPRGSTNGIVLTAKGEIYQFSHPAKWVRILDKFFAVGSGTLTALGALHAGASPKDAVLAASKVDPFSGMGVKVLKFK